MQQTQSLHRHIDPGLKPIVLDDETDPRRSVRREALLLFRSRSGDPINVPTFSRM